MENTVESTADETMGKSSASDNKDFHLTDGDPEKSPNPVHKDFPPDTNKKFPTFTYKDFSLGTDKSPETFLQVAPSTISAVIFTYNPLSIWPLVLRDPCLRRAISNIPVPIPIGPHFTIEKYLTTFSSMVGKCSVEEFKSMPGGIMNFMQVDGVYNLYINEPIESLIHLVLSVDVPLNILEIMLSTCWQPRSLVINSQRAVGICQGCKNRKQSFISPFRKCRCRKEFEHSVPRAEQIFNFYALLSELGVDVVGGIRFYQGNPNKHQEDDDYLYMMFYWEEYESIIREKIRRIVKSKILPSREAVIFIMNGMGMSPECDGEPLDSKVETLLHEMMDIYVLQRGKIVLKKRKDNYDMIEGNLPEFFSKYFVVEG